MKRILFLPLVCLLAWAFTACSRFIAPPYTSVAEISNIKKGMDLNQVNATLGIQPYDIYAIQADGSTILTYNYRVKDRNWAVSGDYTKAIHSERSQKEGKEWYGEPSVVYILFKNGQVSSLITDKGREDAEHLLLINNNIQLISKEELISLQEQPDLMIMTEEGDLKTVGSGKTVGKTKSVLIPIRDSKKSKSAPIQEKVKSKSGRVLAAILVPILILSLIAAI